MGACAKLLQLCLTLGYPMDCSYMHTHDQGSPILGLWHSGLYNPYLEKAMAPHSSTLAWKIPWMEEPGRLQSMGSLRVGHDWATSLSLFTVMHQRKKMATHSSVLAWRIPETAEPGGLPSMGLHRVGHDWSDLATAAAILIYWVCSNLVGCSEASLNLNY